jgi:hypothetical protein
MKMSCPLLVVRELSSSRRFYEQVLGQAVALDFGANITFDGGFFACKRSIHGRAYPQARAGYLLGANNAELYFEEEDFEGFLSRLQKMDGIGFCTAKLNIRGASASCGFTIRTTTSSRWAKPCATVVLRFARQGMTPEQIALRTEHPAEFVLACIANEKKTIRNPDRKRRWGAG